MRDGREVRRVRLDEQPVSRHEAQQVVVGPLAEGNDPAERDAPAKGECGLGKGVRPGIAVQHSADARRRGFADERERVALGVAGVNDNGKPRLGGQLELRRECGALRFAGGVVVVVVEPALADGDGAGASVFAEQRDVPLGGEIRRVVRVYAGGVKYEARVPPGQHAGGSGRIQRLTNADDRLRARGAGALDYLVAVAVERRVREVGVTVDED